MKRLLASAVTVIVSLALPSATLPGTPPDHYASESRRQMRFFRSRGVRMRLPGARPTMRRAVPLVCAMLLSCVIAQPISASEPTGSTGGVLPADPGSRQDQALVLAKEQGRLGISPDGRVQILAAAASSSFPTAVSYPSSVQLDTTWTSKVWEPKGSGTDDNNIGYTDNNYWNFCGPGATAVTLWYWTTYGQPFVTNIAPAAYTEPNPSLSIKATTNWAATDSVSKGRGAIMYLAENELPTPDKSLWAWPGVIDWTSSYPNDGTPVDRIRDALNWEISGRTTISPSSGGPYILTPYTSSLTQGALHTDVLRDLASQPGVPLVANVATSSGRYHLPNWGKRGSVNHSITIVGYDDAKGTYAYIDTCGPGCNNSGAAAGFYTVSQQTLWALLGAETDHDGIIW
jgi:hypothetical protein